MEMFCKYCGKQIPEESEFCKYCGKKLPSVKEQNHAVKIPEAEQIEAVSHNPEEAGVSDVGNKKTFPKWLIIVPAVVLTVCVALGVFLWAYKSNIKQKDTEPETEEIAEEIVNEESESEIATGQTEEQDVEQETETEQNGISDESSVADKNSREEAEPVYVERKIPIWLTSATSYCTSQSKDGQTYEPRHATDGNYTTAWLEGVNGLGVGESISFDFDKTERITKVVIYNGFLNTKYRYAINGKVAKAKLNFDDGTQKSVSLNIMEDVPEDKVPFSMDEMNPTTILFDEPVTASWMKLTIEGAVAGSKYEDVCISEVEIYHEVEVDPSTGADEHYYEFLKGNEPDINGEYFWWSVDTDDVEYALYDMNGDGIHELLVRAYGEWIADVILYRDGKIQYAYVANLGSSGQTFINNKNQFVSVDSGHQGRNCCAVSEVGEPQNAKVVFYLVNYYDDWAASGVPEYYKKENPTEHNLDHEEFDPISEAEYHELLKEYTQENLSINWRPLAEVENIR